MSVSGCENSWSKKDRSSQDEAIAIVTSMSTSFTERLCEYEQAVRVYTCYCSKNHTVRTKRSAWSGPSQGFNLRLNMTVQQMYGRSLRSTLQLCSLDPALKSRDQRRYGLEVLHRGVSAQEETKEANDSHERQASTASYYANVKHARVDVD